MVHGKRIERVMKDLRKLHSEIGQQRDRAAMESIVRALSSVHAAEDSLKGTHPEWLEEEDWS